MSVTCDLRPGVFMTAIWRDPGPRWTVHAFTTLGESVAWAELAGWQWSHTVVAEVVVGMQDGNGADYDRARLRDPDHYHRAQAGHDRLRPGLPPLEPLTREEWEAIGWARGWMTEHRTLTVDEAEGTTQDAEG